MVGMYMYMHVRSYMYMNYTAVSTRGARRAGGPFPPNKEVRTTSSKCAWAKTLKILDRKPNVIFIRKNSYAPRLISLDF
jgi:hypothetical protein